ETAATEMANALQHLADEARHPMDNPGLWLDDQPLQSWDFEFPPLPEIILGSAKDDSLLQEISEARRVFGKEIELTGDVSCAPDGRLAFSVTELNVDNWKLNGTFEPGSLGLSKAAKRQAEHILERHNPGLLAAALVNERRLDEAN